MELATIFGCNHAMCTFFFLLWWWLSFLLGVTFTSFLGVTLFRSPLPSFFTEELLQIGS